MTQVPTVTLVDIDLLKTDNENPNRMTDRQLKALNESVDRFGFIIPIITNKDLLIADGEQRYTVAKSRGMQEVPVVRLDVSDVDRRLLRQVLNKLKGTHQEEMDAQEFLRIVEAGEANTLQSLIQISEKDLTRYLDLLRTPKPEDYEMPEMAQIETDIQLGTTYQLDSHRLMCGDATNKEHITALMNGEQPDMVLTDPPYGIDVVRNSGVLQGYDRRNVLARGSVGGFEPPTFGSNGAKNIVFTRPYMPVIGDDKPFDPTHLLGLAPLVAIFGANYFADKLPPSAGWWIWDKTGGREWNDDFADAELIWSNDKHHAKIYRCTWKGMVKQGETGKRYHPTQKPVKLLSDIIKDFTKNPDIILDPYGGSGSTLIACEQTGRRCRMMEIDPRYCQVIVDRWQNYTGQIATKVRK